MGSTPQRTSLACPSPAPRSLACSCPDQASEREGLSWQPGVASLTTCPLVTRSPWLPGSLLLCTFPPSSHTEAATRLPGWNAAGAGDPEAPSHQPADNTPALPCPMSRTAPGVPRQMLRPPGHTRLPAQALLMTTNLSTDSPPSSAMKPCDNRAQGRRDPRPPAQQGGRGAADLHVRRVSTPSPKMKIRSGAV